MPSRRAKEGNLMSDPYAIRREAERIIGEDRVPTDVLEELIAAHGDDEARGVFGVFDPPKEFDIDGIRAALEGDSNDAEHDALVGVADVLGVEWKSPY